MANLPEPFGSPPGRPGKYVFYVSRHGDDDTQSIVQTFAAAYAARKFLDALLEQDGLIWEDPCTIRSETGIIVSTRWYPERMKKCVEHDYSLAEMAWSLRDYAPDVYNSARRFRSGPELPRTLEDVPERKTRSGKSSAPRADAPSGYVHVSDVALSMGIDAKQARVALRKLYPEGKPAYGWFFDPKTLDEVKAKIKEVVK